MRGRIRVASGLDILIASIFLLKKGSCHVLIEKVDGRKNLRIADRDRRFSNILIYFNWTI